jgi:hypothetical protein
MKWLKRRLQKWLEIPVGYEGNLYGKRIDEDVKSSEPLYFDSDYELKPEEPKIIKGYDKSQ